MSLSAKYIGISEQVAEDQAAIIGSREWFHRRFNRRGSALADTEARDAARHFGRMVGAHPAAKGDPTKLTEEEIKVFIDDELEAEFGPIGRGLENDEVEFLEANPDQIVIDE